MLLIFMVSRAALLSVYFMHNYSLVDVLISADSAGGGYCFPQPFCGHGKSKIVFSAQKGALLCARAHARAHTRTFL